MKFDLGDVLTRAWQITWKHKVLWVFNILPILLSFLFLPVILIPLFFMDPRGSAGPNFVDQPGYALLVLGVGILNTILTMVLYARGSASASLGVLRAEEGEVDLSFRGLFQEGAQFFGRILGITLLVGLGVGLVLTVIFGSIAVISALSMAIGLLCMQPLLLLVYPAMLFVYALMELSQAAAIVEDKGVTAALARGWELIRNNFWSVIVITLLVYLAITMLSAIVMTPFMIPFFAFPFLMGNSQAEFSMRTFVLILAGVSIFLLPVMAIIQGFSLTYIKSAYMIVFLRLRREPTLAPLPGTVEATE